MATLLDVMHAASQLGSGIANLSYKQLEDDARSSLTAQSLDMQQFMADEMQKLSQSTDFDSMGKTFDEDFTRRYNEYNSKNGSHAYKNAYTAKLGNELMMQYKTQGNIAVQKLMESGRRKLSTQEDLNSLDRLSQYEPSQDVLNSQMDIIGRMYSSGRIGEEERWNLSEKVYTASQGKIAEKALYQAVEKNPALLSMSDAELSDWTMKNAPALKASLKGTDGKENELSLSRRKINDSAVQAVRLKVKDTWEKNDTALTGKFVETSYRVMFAPEGSASELVASINMQINAIRRMNNTELSPEMKNAQINRLESLLSPLAQGKGGSSKTAGMDGLIRDLQADIVDAVIRGKENDTDNGIASLERGKEIFASSAHALYLSTGRKAGKSDAEIEDEYQRDYGKLVNDFVLGWKKRIGEQYPALTKTLDKIAVIPDNWKKKEPFKSNPDLAKDLEPELTEFLWDFTAHNDFKNVNAESLRAQVDDYLTRMTGKTFDYLSANREQAAKAYAKDKGFARALTASENDLVFTDIYGKAHAIGGKATEEKLDALNAWQKKDLAAVLGTDNIGELGYEVTDGGSDRNNTMIYQANGRSYKYGVSENGKAPVLYERRGNGPWVEISRQKEAVKARARADTAAAKARAKKAAEKNVRVIQQPREEMRDAARTRSDAPEGISQGWWNNASTEERIMQLDALEEENSTAYIRWLGGEKVQKTASRKRGAQE